MPKISQYPRITALTGTELVPMDSGTSPNYTTVTATTNTLAAAIASGVGVFNTSHAGVVPASPGGTSTVLRADGTWTATFTGTWTFPTLNSTTVSATTGNITTVVSTTVGATTGNITTVNATTVNTGTVAATSQVTIGASNVPAYNATANIVGYYGQTAAEIAASVTPVNFVYAPGDLRRYGCDITGATDNTTQINNAILAATATAGTGYIYHPGGTIAHASQILIPVGGNLTVLGFSRAASIFKFTGSPSGSPAYTRSAWRYAGPNSNPFSGYANVFFRHVKFLYQNSINFAAALEINAYGLSYFEVDDCWISGGCSYGVILDGVEIASVHNSLIENTNAASNYNVWIVNGADRGFTASPPTGFSNIITIRENQISGSTTGYGLIDDGGNEHVVQGNNFNGQQQMCAFAGVTGLLLTGNSFENLQATQNQSANVRFLSASAAGNPVGPCTGIAILANGFFGNMSASGSQLSFQGTLYNISGISKATNGVVTLSSAASANPIVVGQSIYVAGVSGMTQINGQSSLVTAIGGSSGAWTATLVLNTSGFGAYSSGGQVQSMHTGFANGNNFSSVLGRGAAIDVTFLANSACSCNFDAGTGTMAHYTGVHNDNVGNLLQFPQNGGTPGNIGIANPVFGDIRAQTLFSGGAELLGAQVGSAGSLITNKVKGTATFSGTTTQAVTFGTLPSATYQVSLCQSATSTSPPWVTSKATGGFTINFSANFTGTVDWLVEQ